MLSDKNHCLSATRNLVLAYCCSIILYPLRGKFSVGDQLL